MNPDSVSIFDLTPSEKLQLIDDLWDDLAANPADILMPDWQVEELDRRKTRLMSNPALALDWEAVKQTVRQHHDA